MPLGSDSLVDGLNKDWQEECRLWERVSLGDDDARERLILAYRPLVYWYAHKMKVQGGRFSDLVQEGMVALIRAVDNFDLARGYRFTTYSCYRIRGHMLNYLQRVEAKVPVPLEIEESEASPEFRDVEEILTLRDGLLHLPPREAAILQALVVDCRSAKDLAKEQRVDISHVYRLKRRAVERLRHWFGLKDATAEIERG